ncbi:MAG: DUF934 domain-containing protein [Gammaproteobacteria bacterium]
MHYATHAGAFVDDWTLDPDATGGRSSRHIVLDLEAWRVATAGGTAAALLLDGATAIEDLAIDPARCALVAVAFSHFTDGRGYSLARLLRRNGVACDLRAVGDVRPDQVFALARCGFSSFGAADVASARQLASRLADFSAVYQPAADDRVPIPALRRLRRASG